MENFEEIELLGKGYSGTVWKVKRKVDRKMYAMKRINVTGISHDHLQNAFNEIRFLASIDHPNIVGFHESFLSSSYLCIVLELCCHGDLAQEIACKQKERVYFQNSTIWSYLIQLLNALQILHKHNIVHRDVKPENIFVGAGKVIKLGDMNISKRMKNEMFLRTQTGTPYYMAPELWGKLPYDQSSDMWSLGVVLYEICTLRKPFQGGNFQELRFNVEQGLYPAITVSRISRDMILLVESLLQGEPMERPTADHLLRYDLVDQRRSSFHTECGSLNLLETICIPVNFTASDLSKQYKKPTYPGKELAKNASVKDLQGVLQGRAQSLACIPASVGLSKKIAMNSTRNILASKKNDQQYGGNLPLIHRHSSALEIRAMPIKPKGSLSESVLSAKHTVAADQALLSEDVRQKRHSWVT